MASLILVTHPALSEHPRHPGLETGAGARTGRWVSRQTAGWPQRASCVHASSTAVWLPQILRSGSFSGERVLGCDKTMDTAAGD